MKSHRVQHRVQGVLIRVQHVLRRAPVRAQSRHRRVIDLVPRLRAQHRARERQISPILFLIHRAALALDVGDLFAPHRVHRRPRSLRAPTLDRRQRLFPSLRRRRLARGLERHLHRLRAALRRRRRRDGGARRRRVVDVAASGRGRAEGLGKRASHRARARVDDAREDARAHAPRCAEPTRRATRRTTRAARVDYKTRRRRSVPIVLGLVVGEGVDARVGDDRRRRGGGRDGG